MANGLQGVDLSNLRFGPDGNLFFVDPGTGLENQIQSFGDTNVSAALGGGYDPYNIQNPFSALFQSELAPLQSQVTNLQGQYKDFLNEYQRNELQGTPYDWQNTPTGPTDGTGFNKGALVEALQTWVAQSPEIFSPTFSPTFTPPAYTPPAINYTPPDVNYTSGPINVAPTPVTVNPTPVNVSGGFSGKAFEGAFQNFLQDQGNRDLLSDAIPGITSTDLDQWGTDTGIGPPTVTNVLPPEVNVSGGFGPDEFETAFLDFLGTPENVSQFTEALGLPDFSPEINVAASPVNYTAGPVNVDGGFSDQAFQQAFLNFLDEPGNESVIRDAFQTGVTPLELGEQLTNWGEGDIFSPNITVETPEVSGGFSNQAFEDAFRAYLQEPENMLQFSTALGLPDFSPNISVDGGFDSSAYWQRMEEFSRQREEGGQGQTGSGVPPSINVMGGLTPDELDLGFDRYFGEGGLGENIFSDAVSGYQAPGITVEPPDVSGGFGSQEFATAFMDFLNDPVKATHLTESLGLPDFSPEINVSPPALPKINVQGGLTDADLQYGLGKYFQDPVTQSFFDSLIPDVNFDYTAPDITVEGGFDSSNYWNNWERYMDNRDWGDIGGGGGGGFNEPLFMQNFEDFLTDRDWSGIGGGGGEVTVEGGLTPDELQAGFGTYFGPEGAGYKTLQDLIPEAQESFGYEDLENWWTRRGEGGVDGDLSLEDLQEWLRNPATMEEFGFGEFQDVGKDPLDFDDWNQWRLDNELFGTEPVDYQAELAEFFGPEGDFFGPDGYGASLIPDPINWQNEFGTYFGPGGAGAELLPTGDGGTVVNVNQTQTPLKFSSGIEGSTLEAQLNDLEERWNTWHDDFSGWQSGLPTEIVDELSSIYPDLSGGDAPLKMGGWDDAGWQGLLDAADLIAPDDPEISAWLNSFKDVNWDLSAEPPGGEGGEGGGAPPAAEDFDPWSGEVYTDEFQGLNMPEIVDYTDALRLPAINTALSGLTAPSPWDVRRNEYISGATAPLHRAYDDAKERMISTGGVLNKLGTPGFRSELRELEEARAAEEGRIGSQFQLEAARTDEPYRRNRLADVTSLLDKEHLRTQGAISLQDALNRGAMTDYYNQLNQWRTGYSAPDAYADAGINLGLGGIGSTTNTSGFGADAISGASAVGTSAQNAIAANRESIGNIFSTFEELWKEKDN